jgi:hypothetical protein
VDRAFNVVIFKRVTRIDIQDSINVETLTKFMFFVKDAVMREKCAVHDADGVHGSVSY